MTVASGKPRPAPLSMPKRRLSLGPFTPKTPQDEAIAFFSAEHSGNPVVVYELWLDGDGGPPDGMTYIRLPPPVKPYVLRFCILAGTAVTRNGILKSDFPLDGGVFEREVWSERALPSDVSKPIHVDFAISAPGAFSYFIEHDMPESGRVVGRRGYFNIDPCITLPLHSPFILEPGGDPLHDTRSGAVTSKTGVIALDGLVILSVIAKWQGRTNEWDSYYSEATRRGYNMIHYTPLHPRGSSGSPYSIMDQLAFDPTLLTNNKAGDGGLHEMMMTLDRAKSKYGLGSITDVVLNHTAFDSPWLEDHPEAGYSPHNTPHLAPAVALEDAMFALTDKLPELGLPTVIKNEDDLQRIAAAVQEAINKANIWRYYVFDVTSSVKDVEAVLKSGKFKEWPTGHSLAGNSFEYLARTAHELNDFIENMRAYSAPYCTTVNPEKAAAFAQAAWPDDDAATQASKWGKVLDVLNVDLYNECNEDLAAAKNGVVGRLRYTRLEEGGPKLGEINKTNPLVEQYFTRIPHTAKTAKFPSAALAVANNGWMWAADPLKNFAEYPSKAYLRREVIVWGDCVKLRYGRGRDDNPWLWDHMTEYAETLAGVFDGFRLDNCHSTPLHVGVHIIDAGRRINPNLYVMAELFTGSEEMDLTFVQRLGLNSLIREAYNGNDTKDFARLIYRFGVGKPIGSMDGACLSRPDELPPLYEGGAPRPCIITPVHGSQPHAVFYDVTHDNESPSHKRTAEDALSTGALVTFAKAAVGSNKGFDDLYPNLLNLVTDTRMYNVKPDQEDEQGIGRVKRVLNNLHTEMMTQYYAEGHVHEEGPYIMVHRVHPITHKGYLLVAHTAFPGDSGRGQVSPFRLSRTNVKYLFGATLHTRRDQWKDDDKTHYGIPSTLQEIATEKVKIRTGTDDHGDYTEVTVPDRFDPGSIMVFSTEMGEMSSELDIFCRRNAGDAFTDLDLVDLNVVLHRADGEERDATGGNGVYDIPGYGPLVYCGLEGWMSALRHIMRNNDLGHPLCAHLREGTWALDYVHGRLESQTNTLPNLAKPAAWFKERFDVIKKTVPDFMRPKYFSLVIYEAYKAARRAVIEQQAEFILNGPEFTQDLALCAVQMYGLVSSASIIPSKAVPSLAAGLPHFTAGWARCWGRDVFISLRGLFLTTGNYTAARDHIHAFGSTLKHGLIPNLLDSGRNPRYNSRDSPWWFIQNIQDYTKMAPDGLSILEDFVKRRFPEDETWVPWDDPRAFAYSSTVAEIIQEIVQRHAEGIEFREWNAGPNLDGDMTDAGFNQKIWTDWNTGFIFGGNRYNCGTWMDKMGSSAKAGNKGLPATPRDGAPIEITGLLYSTLVWLDDLSSKGVFPFEGVNANIHGQKGLVTYKAWADLIKRNFEKHYFVPSDPADDGEFVINQTLVNRRGMYKDVYGTPKDREWADYQLRCNFTLPMIVAQDLFTPSRAMEALRLADSVIRGPLGMKTLDPADSQYRPNYDNSNDSTDQAVAKGWNYHQGPEWGFPLGWFLRAWVRFDTLVGSGAHDPLTTFHHISSVLLKLREHVATDPWRGLPELTNDNGAFCFDSCATQAWSSSTILDLLEELHQLGNEI